MKLACVIQRFGPEIAGGSERHCRVVAEHLAAAHDVTILTTCAHGAVKSPGKFQKLFRRWEKRLGKGKAIVAVAHRMIEVIFALLSRGESYSEERAEKTHAKIVRMKNRARALPTRDPASRWAGLGPVTQELLRGTRS